MTPEERIRSKIAGLKANQAERQSAALRDTYTQTIGVGDEAYQTNTPRIPAPNARGRNRGRTVEPGYKYSDDVLQAALDAASTDNSIMSEIFNQTLEATGNPDLATAAAEVANYTPGVGTAIGFEDAYDAAANIPDAYRAGDYGAVAQNAGGAALGVLDAALTFLPFAKPLLKRARNIPQVIRTAQAKSEIEQRGNEILEMLKSGNAGSITDEMFDMGDSTKNAMLNQYLSQNYDLPMDAASRAQRRQDMGFGLDVSHGTRERYDQPGVTPDITVFEPSYKGKTGRGVYLDPRRDKQTANRYAGFWNVDSTETNPKLWETSGSVYPMAAKSGPYVDHGDFRRKIDEILASREVHMGNRSREFYRAKDKANDFFENEGYVGVKNDDIYGSQPEVTVYDPSNLRSIFARFDPRLAHLKNLTAGIGTAGVSAAAIEEYLNEVEREGSY